MCEAINMIQFMKTPKSSCGKDGVTVNMTLENDESLDTILETFKGFLQACTFPIDADEVLGVFKHHDELEDDDLIDDGDDDDDFFDDLIDDEIGSCGCECNCKNDDRIDIDIELPDDAFAKLCEIAHDRDITLNDLCNNILKDYLDEMDAQDEFASIVDKLKN